MKRPTRVALLLLGGALNAHAATIGGVTGSSCSNF
jgi:hypothetical protein